MGFHTFDVNRADQLEDAARRYRYLSEEELLWLVDPSPEDSLADLGSGTGFYTDSVAAGCDTVYAVDVQEGMHEYYRRKGVPETVTLVTAAVADLPFDARDLDGAFTTMTYHEFGGGDAVGELARVIASGGRLVIVDWNADGNGDAGPPLDERYDLPTIESQLRAHEFRIERAESRRETIVVVASR